MGLTSTWSDVSRFVHRRSRSRIRVDRSGQLLVARRSAVNTMTALLSRGLGVTGWVLPRRGLTSPGSCTDGGSRHTCRHEGAVASTNWMSTGPRPKIAMTAGSG